MAAPSTSPALCSVNTTADFVHPYYRDRIISSDEWKILRLADYWQYFITPTFSEVGTHSGRVQRVNNWLRKIARYGSATKRYLIYVVRWERGECGDRPHCHIFLGGMTTTNVISLRWILINSWEHGRIDVRHFDRGRIRKGANYLGGDSDWEKNRYEIGKFRTADIVHFSRHADEVLAQLQGIATASI